MLKQLRIEKKMTQKQAAEALGISLRSYKAYENDEDKKSTLKYQYLVERLRAINPIDEEHGILELSDIQQKCSAIFQKYNVEYCYLFGSYAKGNAGALSDVDLLIASDITGLKFYGLVEELRENLKKKVDALDIEQLRNNYELLKEILKDGIKIYG